METRLAGRAGLWVALALALAVRLPFLNQAIQGDDHIYISEATHALIDPLHPADMKYVFRGVEVDLRGQPHPPLNAWALAGLLAVFGEAREVPFHTAYILFTLIAVVSMWSLARRFSPRPLWATLLFLVVPTFVVNGNSLETDLPFLAFWMGSIALFTSRRYAPAAVCMALAAMTSYQAVFLIPILAVYAWLFRRGDRAAFACLMAPVLVIAGWQIFERISTGALPAKVLGGYLTEFQTAEAKLRSALMLFIHSWWIVFPALVPGAFLVAWRKRREPDTLFLLAWIAIFFAGAVVIFFAGSARYLLPMAAPVCLLASRLRTRWLAVGFAAQLPLALGLAAVNYQHWGACREFARSLRPTTADHRVWANADLGLRYYAELDGALPLKKGQAVRPGEFIITSEMTRMADVIAPAAVIARQEIRPAIPLRLIGVESSSGYSTVSRGFWPFGLSAGVIDRMTAEKVVERRATLEYLPMNAPEAGAQIVSGFHALEENAWRWMARSGVVALKSPAAPLPLRVEFTIPDNAPARRVSLRLDGKEVASRAYTAPGSYTLETAAPARPAAAEAIVEIEVDRTFSAPPDTRELGIVVTAVGFRNP